MESLSSWRDVDEVLADRSWGRHDEHARSTLVFRGLSRASYRCVSSLPRAADDPARVERHLLRNFRKYAHQETPGPTTWDWLSLGQHHGLPTRLLDWTFSPLVALHFATASAPEEDGLLWAVDPVVVHRELPGRLSEALEREGSLVFTTGLLGEVVPEPCDLDSLVVDEPFALFFEPPTLDTRIAAQAAVFSVLADPGCDMQGWLEARPEAGRCWRVPPEVKLEVRERLDQAQVNERMLMPGLDGLAAWLRRYYSPRSVDEDGGAAMDDEARRRAAGMAS